MANAKDEQNRLKHLNVPSGFYALLHTCWYLHFLSFPLPPSIHPMFLVMLCMYKGYHISAGERTKAITSATWT